MANGIFTKEDEKELKILNREAATGGSFNRKKLKELRQKKSDQLQVDRTVDNMGAQLDTTLTGSQFADTALGASPLVAEGVKELTAKVTAEKAGEAAATTTASSAGAGAGSAASGGLSAGATAGIGIAAGLAGQAIRAEDPYSKGAGTVGGALSGAGTGMALGSMLAPGVGTAVGAIGGAILGGIRGRSAAKSAKRAALAQIESDRLQAESAILGEKGRRIDNALAGLRQGLSQALLSNRALRLS